MTLNAPGIGNFMDYELTYSNSYNENIKKLSAEIKKRTMPICAMYFDDINIGLRFYINPFTKLVEKNGYKLGDISYHFHNNKINKILTHLVKDLYPEYSFNEPNDLFIHFAKYHYVRPYCQWCSCPETVDNKHIIEHSHLIPSLELNTITNKPKYWIGRYRGKLCRRCNIIEATLKNKYEKVEYLKSKCFDEISAKIIIENWY